MLEPTQEAARRPAGPLTGRRARYEHACFARRRALCALAMAACFAPEDARAPDALADLAWAVCEESAWQLPAHNAYARSAPGRIRRGSRRAATPTATTTTMWAA